MRKIEIDELRKIQMEILDYVAEFCEKNRIHYWLDSGTLLGAIRHKGYIPWDDDIDLGMLRPDFECFCELFSHQNEDARYRLRYCEMDKNWHMPFGKVEDTTTVFLQDGHKFGINIDIFIYDNVPNYDTATKMYDKRDFLMKLNAVQIATKPPRGHVVRKSCVYVARALLKLFPRFYFVRKIARNAQTYAQKECALVGNFTGQSRMTPCDKVHVQSVMYGTFEGKTYKIPVGYDQWLRSFFGSTYMQLPPEDKRKRHTFEAYVND